MIFRRDFIKISLLSPLILSSSFSVYTAGCVKRYLGYDKKHRNYIEILYAGSLQREMEEIKQVFEEKTGIEIRCEAKGSVMIVNLVKDGYIIPDIIISADITLLDELIPKIIDKYFIFASNSIVLANSFNSTDLTNSNWMSELLSGKYKIGMSNPLSDPLGYRTLITLKLAERYYNIETEELEELVNNILIFGDEIDLLANLKMNNIDMAFLYKNMAINHNLKFIELPDKINLGSFEYEDFYNKVEISVGDRKYKGRTILYGIAKTRWGIDNSFLSFFMREGLKILKKHGFRIMVMRNEVQ